MPEELKPCPFCGSNNLTVGTNSEEDGDLLILLGWCCYCKNCNSQGPLVDREKPWISKDNAIAAWNIRPGEEK